MSRPVASGETHLQKAALLNSTLVQNMASINADQTPLEFDGMVSGLGNPYGAEFDMMPDDNQIGYPGFDSGHLGPMPSPESSDLLNYDALDHELGPSVPDDDENMEGEMVYSDFSKIDPDKPIPDDTDFVDPFQSNDVEPLPLEDVDEDDEDEEENDQAVEGLVWQNRGYGDVSALHYVP